MNRDDQQRQQSTLDRITGRGLIAASAISGDYLKRFMAFLERSRPRDPFTIMAAARKLLAEFEPDLGRTIAAAQLAAWVMGTKVISDRLPDWAKRRMTGLQGPPPGRIGFEGFDPSPGGPLVRFPLMERAAESLLTRNILQADLYYRTADNIRARSFTVAGDLTIETIDSIRNILGEQIRQGASFNEFKSAIADGLEESFIAPWHAETVFRTNVQTAYRDGRNTAARDPIVSRLFPYKRYVAIHDGRVRKEHLRLEKLGLNGTDVYRADDPFWTLFDPPWDYNCVLPGSLVQGRVQAAYKSWYSGQAVEVTTMRGNCFRITGNHPVLTPQGFVSARTLAQGGDLLSYRGGREFAATHPSEHKHNSPLPIEQVFSALADLSGTRRLPVEPDNFHGDARHGNGNVDAVAVNRELLDNLEPGGSQRFSDFILAGMDARLPDNGGAAALDFSPLHYLGVGPASQLDASRYENATDNTAIDAEFFRQFLDRYAGQVEADKIVQIRNFDFTGHVYDLQTEGGWMVADGTVVSNCRCGAILLTIEAAARLGVKEAQQWLRDGHPPEYPEYRLASIPFRPRAGWTTTGGSYANAS